MYVEKAIVRAGIRVRTVCMCVQYGVARSARYC